MTTVERAPAEKLAIWVQTHVPQKSGPLSQLKLQKLLFYCYGAALAFRVEDEIGDVDFEAWRHGPVNPDVFERYRQHGGQSLPPPRPNQAPRYDLATEPMNDTLAVYSWLDAWGLRQQSHLETPWKDAERLGGRSTIDREQIRKHFIRKFRENVRVPEYLGRSWSFAIDGIPTTRFESLHQLADTLRARLG